MDLSALRHRLNLCRLKSAAYYGVWPEGRNTPIVVQADNASSARSKAKGKNSAGSKGPISAVKKLDSKDSAKAEKGEWIRTRSDGTKVHGKAPADKSPSKYRPQFKKKSSAMSNVTLQQSVNRLRLKSASTRLMVGQLKQAYDFRPCGACPNPGICDQEKKCLRNTHGKQAGDKKPWDKPNPKGSSSKLTPEQKAKAKAKAKKAGRPYPNLVDNMNAKKQANVLIPTLGTAAAVGGGLGLLRSRPDPETRKKDRIADAGRGALRGVGTTVGGTLGAAAGGLGGAAAGSLLGLLAAYMGGDQKVGPASRTDYARPAQFGALLGGLMGASAGVVPGGYMGYQATKDMSESPHEKYQNRMKYAADSRSSLAYSPTAEAFTKQALGPLAAAGFRGLGRLTGKALGLGASKAVPKAVSRMAPPPLSAGRLATRATPATLSAPKGPGLLSRAAKTTGTLALGATGGLAGAGALASKYSDNVNPVQGFLTPSRHTGDIRYDLDGGGHQGFLERNWHKAKQWATSPIDSAVASGRTPGNYGPSIRYDKASALTTPAGETTVGPTGVKTRNYTETLRPTLSAKLQADLERIREARAAEQRIEREGLSSLIDSSALTTPAGETTVGPTGGIDPGTL